MTSNSTIKLGTAKTSRLKLNSPKFKYLDETTWIGLPCFGLILKNNIQIVGEQKAKANLGFKLVAYVGTKDGDKDHRPQSLLISTEKLFKLYPILYYIVWNNSRP